MENARKNLTDFYPRSPRGERLVNPPVMLFCGYFYPRSPRGERRAVDKARPRVEIISIHAPREGSDSTARPLPMISHNFYPRSPRGERRTDRLRHIWG